MNKAKAAEQHREDVRKAEAQELARKLSGRVIRVSARAGEGGRLYGSVTAQEIADALNSQHGVKIEKRRVELPGAHPARPPTRRSPCGCTPGIHRQDDGEDRHDQVSAACGGWGGKLHPFRAA